MGTLYKHGRKVHSVFELLGTKEDDISFSIGYGFSKIPSFLKPFLHHIGIRSKFNPESISIRLQQYEKEKGRTDFEIEQEGVFSIIIESKKGWNFPNQKQLDQYSSKPSFIKSTSRVKKLVVFTESTKEYTDSYFDITKSNGYEVQVVSYRELHGFLRQSSRLGTNFEKRLTGELLTYLEKIMTMSNKESNLVYVVSLGKKVEPRWKISYIEIVERRLYFHPIGSRGFPSEPPNYIGFRYDGQLQSIHYIESYEVFQNPHKFFPEIPSQNWGSCFLYHLGEPIVPNRIVKTGKIYRNGRVWCMFDTLFTSDTIKESSIITKKRLNENNDL